VKGWWLLFGVVVLSEALVISEINDLKERVAALEGDLRQHWADNPIDDPVLKTRWDDVCINHNVWELYT
jgi:hypothetical protein